MAKWQSYVLPVMPKKLPNRQNSAISIKSLRPNKTTTKLKTMKDYILVRNKIPVEPEDVIYSAESVVDLFNDGFYLGDDEQFIEYQPATNQEGIK